MEKEKTYGVVNTSKEKAEITLNLISRCTAAYNGFPGVFFVFFFITKHSTFFHLLEWELGGGGSQEKNRC